MRGLLQRQVLGSAEAAPGISTVMVDAFNIVQDRIARSRLAGDPPDAMIYRACRTSACSISTAPKS